MKTRGRRFSQVPIDHAGEGESRLIFSIEPAYLFQLRDIKAFATEETANRVTPKHYVPDVETMLQ